MHAPVNWLHKIEPAVVHRDLKTPNLLVEKLGTEYRVKVAGTWGSPHRPLSLSVRLLLLAADMLSLVAWQTLAFL